MLLCSLVLTNDISQGGKNRRRGKNENDDDKRELVFREDGQVYAQVTKMLGNGRLEAMCFDGEKRLAHIRGKMRKKVCAVAAFVPTIIAQLSKSGMDQSGRHHLIVVT
jgi:initiation factor 1A